MSNNGNNNGKQENKFKIEQENDDVVIRMPIDLLRWTQERREEPYTISSTNEMIEAMKQHLLEYKQDTYEEDSAFHHFLNDFFDEMYWDGEYWIDGIWNVDGDVDSWIDEV